MFEVGCTILDILRECLIAKLVCEFDVVVWEALAIACGSAASGGWNLLRVQLAQDRHYITLPAAIT